MSQRVKTDLYSFRIPDSRAILALAPLNVGKYETLFPTYKS